MKLIDKEKRKISSGYISLRRRRINWSLHIRQKILDTCNQFSDKALKDSYPFRLTCYSDSQNPNAESIQYKVGINYTGIEHKETKISEDGSVQRSRKLIIEKDCALIFSQMPCGRVMVLLYPYKSEVHQRSEENIILHYALEPEKFTEKFINKTIEKCLFYARMSSVVGFAGGSNWRDYMKLNWYKFGDLRAKQARVKSMTSLRNEWWKIIVTIALTLTMTLIAQSFGVSGN
ncbi:hypothetical protein FCV87_05055 [Vibrio breoganii]|uniref:hypothetical protein n=1 Tax=Vibrio breoganii TaxID=553239 RepID=UPI000C83058D|nr:hypothetical protein [Vibrio breoganii]PMG93581.1 hypothetical protein BCU80_08310 [Vibrio breoganii]PML28188.1 hypothetical protein BCT82_01910 [Vibrio breoganii]TKG30956.1 hypothetical protein FCV87_05055 [Vibrio breoganii]